MLSGLPSFEVSKPDFRMFSNVRCSLSFTFVPLSFAFEGFVSFRAGFEDLGPSKEEDAALAMGSGATKGESCREEFGFLTAAAVSVIVVFD